jgi:hypothetical protein
MKESEVKTYFLFVFSNFKENPNLIGEIPRGYEPLVSSNTLKFNYGEQVMVCHFESDVPFIELEEFSHDFLTYENCQFFIMETNKNISTNLSTDLKLNLFDLNTEINQDIDWDMECNEINKNLNLLNWFSTISNKNDEGFFYDFEEEDDDDIDLISFLTAPKLSLDDILDKIQEKGLSSLTDNEKQILEQYGQ